MITPQYVDGQVKLYTGDAATVCAELEPGSIGAVVTSPPYFGLRDYGGNAGQIGGERTVAEYVASLVAVFQALRPALAPHGVVWVNLGDTYNSYNGNRGPSTSGVSKNGPMPALPKGYGLLDPTRPPKSLLQVPAQFALGMQDAGWVLRSKVVWVKPNPMPDTAKDRPAQTYEELFMFVTSRHYTYNMDAVAEPVAEASLHRWAQNVEAQAGSSRAHGGVRTIKAGSSKETRNTRNVWEIATVPFTDAHFATMPPALAERCVLASSRPGEVVLDPFSGAGTTGYAATRAGRRYVGVDLSAEYHDIALRTRLAQGALIEGDT